MNPSMVIDISINFYIPCYPMPFAAFRLHSGITLGSTTLLSHRIHLGSLWGHLGVILRSVQVDFGSTLERLWDHLAVTLESLWNHLRCTLGLARSKCGTYEFQNNLGIHPAVAMAILRSLHIRHRLWLWHEQFPAAFPHSPLPLFRPQQATQNSSKCSKLFCIIFPMPPKTSQRSLAPTVKQKWHWKIQTA